MSRTDFGVWLLVWCGHSLPNRGGFFKDVVSTTSRYIQDARHRSISRSYPRRPYSKIHATSCHIPQVWRNLAYSEQIVTDLHLGSTTHNSSIEYRISTKLSVFFLLLIRQNILNEGNLMLQKYISKCHNLIWELDGKDVKNLDLSLTNL